MNHTQYDYDKLFLAYEESRADITAHFRKIMELEREIEKLKKQNDILKDALEFYASGDSWAHISKDIAQYIVIKEDEGNGDFQLNDITDDFRVGGVKARQTLAKVEEIERGDG